MFNFGNILWGSPQTNIAVVGQGNTQGALNIAGGTLGQGIVQVAANESLILQSNTVVDS